MPEGLVPGTARLVTRRFNRGGDNAGKESVAVGPGH
jgi:hypothetical protein